MAAKKGMKKVAAKAPTGKKRGRPKKVQKKTYIALVIDRSGSMSSVRQAAFDGINEQLKTIRENATKGGETFVTYVQFDDIVDVVYDKKPATEALDIGWEQYSPRNWTALRDGVWRAIKNLQEAPEGDDVAYMVAVITDGGENASKEITAEKLKAEIQTLEATGKWTFTYMMSNVDAWAVGQTFGAYAGNIATYTSNTVGTAAASNASAGAVAQYLSVRSAGKLSSHDLYASTLPSSDDPNAPKLVTPPTPNK